MLQKIKYLVFFLPFLVVLLMVVILLSLSKPISQTPQQQGIPTPTEIPIENPFLHGIQTEPPVVYSRTGVQKQTDLFTNRVPLSSSDSATRQNLAYQATEANPLLMVTQTFRLEYLSAPNEFLSEILTTNLQQGKKDTISWLESQGMSFQGICHLPLFFYINPDVAQQLQGKGILFSPIPDGC